MKKLTFGNIPGPLTAREEVLYGVLERLRKDVNRNYGVNLRLYKNTRDPLVKEGGYRASEELRTVKRALDKCLKAVQKADRAEVAKSLAADWLDP